MPEVIFDPKVQPIFDAAYWASQPPEIRAAFQDPNTPTADRQNKAVELMGKGAVIDVPIFAWGWNPYATMVQRVSEDWAWIPSGTQARPPLGPGIHVPGMPDYDPTPPAGSVHPISINPADFPPFDVPPPAPLPSHRMVGIFSFSAPAYGNVYVSGPDAIVNGKPQVSDKQTVVQDGVTYTAVLQGQGGMFHQPILWFTGPAPA